MSQIRPIKGMESQSSLRYKDNGNNMAFTGKAVSGPRSTPNTFVPFPVRRDLDEGYLSFHKGQLLEVSMCLQGPVA